MIRREHTTRDGRPGWLLIPQTEHARVAGRLAEFWGRAPFHPVAPRDELLDAIHHHDDGWAEWDAEADVEPATGRPRDFLEMDLPVALAIWQRSIDGCRDRIGPLAGYLVSQHFCKLLERWSRAALPAESQRLATAFQREQATQQHDWLRTWQSEAADHRNAETAELGVRLLQFFDWFSLWLCCRTRTQAEVMAAPAAAGDEPIEVVVTPLAHNLAAVDPWPFLVERLDVTAVGRWVPEARYASRAALANEPPEAMELRWRLVGAAR